MEKGLVGGINPTTTSITSSSNGTVSSLLSSASTNSSSVTAALGETSSGYSARILNTESAPVLYTGGETDSMIIDVDPGSKVITGEVKWRSMLSSNESQDDFNHAYRADRARVKFDTLSESVGSLANTVKDLEVSCGKSSLDLKSYIKKLEVIREDLVACQDICNSLQTSIQTEAIQRKQSDKLVESKASDNLYRLQSEFSKLVTETDTKLSDQDMTVKKFEDTIQNEVLRAKTEEEKLSKEIQSTLAYAQDTSVKVSTLNVDASNLASRISNLENSQVIVNSDNNEERIRVVENKITNLSASLRKTSGDTRNLEAKVEIHESELTRIKAQASQNRSDISDLISEHRLLDDSVSTIDTKLASEIAKRDGQYVVLNNRIMNETELRKNSDEYHDAELARLEIRISDLQRELTVVIQNIADEIHSRYEQISESLSNLHFDFVDAGTAPI